MELKEITAGELSLCINKLPGHSGLFLQTPSWQKLEQTEGLPVEILGFYQGVNLVGGALVVTRRMRSGFTYFYIPKGPLILEVKYLNEVLDLLLARYENRGLFLRIEPPIEINNHHNLSVNLIKAGWYKSRAIQAAATLITDLTKTPEELLMVMHPKTRYNIHLAEKKGLLWQLTRKQEDLLDFYQLLIQTSKRNNFRLHQQEHYANLLELFGSEELKVGTKLAVRIAKVIKEEKLLAASLLIFSRGIVTYLHGASANEARELMPNHLLHWQTMLYAKSLGFKYYDWWGIETPEHPRSSWQGITRFKLGFGGKVVNYLGTFDYPYKKLLYFLYRGTYYFLV